jgi:DNA-binding HxlR family transcriptional regulator
MLSVSERSYGQYCGLAAALDAIGERWSLLIVRDLSLGPRRSIDLQRSLPGIPTNVLYTRLAALQARGIVTRRVAPPPTPATLYELTETGRLLEPALDALDRWGLARLSKSGPTSVVRADYIERALGRFVKRLDAPAFPFTLEARVADRGYAAVWSATLFARERALVAEGASESPDLTLRCDLATLYALAAGALAPRDARERGRVRVDGRATVVRRLFGNTRSKR